MGFLHEIRNLELIKDLDREINTDVLLFGVDGFTYYGNLQAIEDCRVAILTPAITAESNEVEILTPGGEIREVTFLRVDLWSIIAKGSGIVNDPFNSTASVNNALNVNGVIGLGQRDGEEQRQESHDLVCQLKRMIGDTVVLTTLGGFLFEGTLGAIDDCLALLTVNSIFVPGTDECISNRDVRSVIVNLESLTSVSTVCCC